MTEFLLFTAAFFAGAINAVAGGGTFLVFPALIFAGVPPIVANATSTMAVWPGTLASIAAYRREIKTQLHTLPSLFIISLLGGLAGAWVLLHTPEKLFTFLIPYLLLAATLLFAFGGTIIAAVREKLGFIHRHSRLILWTSAALQLGIAFYGGYFGAGIGILMLAMLQLRGLSNIHEMNGIKTVLGGAINGVAVVTFILMDAINWPKALLMMAGAIMGGYGGAALARRLPPTWVRGIVIAIGSGMTIYFFLFGSQ